MLNGRILTITNGSTTNDLTFLVSSETNNATRFKFQTLEISLSPVMCREQPLSRYHDWCLRGAVKDICNINNFVLRYPSSGSFWVSFTRSSGNLWCSSLWIFRWNLSMRFSL